jgi:ketosteroid isomerase-like protein
MTAQMHFGLTNVTGSHVDFQLLPVNHYGRAKHSETETCTGDTVIRTEESREGAMRNGKVLRKEK